MKRCRKCQAEKHLRDFPPLRHASDGRGSWCRVCAGVASAAWRKRNRLGVATYLRQWRERKRQEAQAMLAANPIL